MKNTGWEGEADEQMSKQQKCPGERSLESQRVLPQAVLQDCALELEPWWAGALWDGGHQGLVAQSECPFELCPLGHSWVSPGQQPWVILLLLTFNVNDWLWDVHDKAP